ncbi:MAG: DUF188 domain-containing protein [Treponema sp.]
MITVWVDADSCPKSVRTYLIDYSFKLQIKINFVANKKIPCHNEHSFFSMIITDSQSQAADNYIFDNVSQYDIVITRDILLAERLVDKGIAVLNDRGNMWTGENIKERKSERDFNLQLALIGLGGSTANSYGKEEFAKFANCFDKEIHRLMKKEKLQS